MKAAECTMENAHQYMLKSIAEYFKIKDYTEGAYKDNRFMDMANKYYDKETDNFSIWEVDLFDDLKIKVFTSYSDEDINLVSEEQFYKRAIEYIDWLFKNNDNQVSWPIEEYINITELIPNIRHQKWINNKITTWWKRNKDKDLKDIYKKDWEIYAKTHDLAVNPYIEAVDIDLCELDLITKALKQFIEVEPGVEGKLLKGDKNENTK